MSIRAAFEYSWFPETWPASPQAAPLLGQYASSDPAVIQAHIWMMRYAGIKVGISSWWGPESPYSPRLQLLLDATAGIGFKWCAYYEGEGYEAPSITKIDADLKALAPIAAHDRYQKLDGKPVLFVYADPTDGAEMAKRWVTANAGRFYIVLKVFDGYRTCGYQPDSWHQYAPANNVQSALPYSFTVSPGFWKADEPAPRLVRDPDRFRDDVKAMRASGADWQLITTFNEFGEGTAIEPTTDWGSTYLDILRRN